MTKKKIILIVILSLLILTTASIFAPVCVDKFFWGNDFEESLITSNINEMENLISEANVGYYKDNSKNYKDGLWFYSYYYNTNEKERYGLYIGKFDEVEFPYETKIKESISYKGRKVYMSAFFEYKGSVHEIKFEGNRWFFGKYSWKMLDSEFFPIKDENFVNTPDVFADR